MVGTQGVPANYGGFESLVENLIGKNCPDDVEYTVFCSSRDLPSCSPKHKGAELKYVPLSANGAQSVPYDVLSLCRCIRGYDVVLVLGVSGACFLPVFRMMSNAKIIVNIDGLEHMRDKWGSTARKFLKFSERMAVKAADIIVADNKGISDYVEREYGRESALIAYGGDHAERQISKDFVDKTLADYGVKAHDYAIAVCRIEPENNSRMVLQAFAESGKQLVYIGNWSHSDYSCRLRDEYKDVPNIHMIDAVYDLDILYALRSNASIYIHGHSAGGTNPSLVEAMCFGIPILAYDVVYNRETTENKAYYFSSADELCRLLGENLRGEMMPEIARRRYRWSIVAGQYAELY